MVGEARAGGDPVPGLSASIGRAYDTGAAAWADGPAAAYAELARVLVRRVPVPLAGRCVLDLGAGTGAAGMAAVRAGAGLVVAADLAPAMLARCRPWLTPVAADAARLPFAAGAFDVVLAAFSLSHVPGLPAALHECRRVAGVLVASAFAAGWTHRLLWPSVPDEPRQQTPHPARLRSHSQSLARFTHLLQHEARCWPKAHAAWSRRPHRLEPDPATASVVRWMFPAGAPGSRSWPSCWPDRAQLTAA